MNGLVAVTSRHINKMQHCMSMQSAHDMGIQFERYRASYAPTPVKRAELPVLIGNGSFGIQLAVSV